MITITDLKATSTRELNDNSIRKAWVLQANEEMRESFRKLPREVRFALYAEIDADVSAHWVKEMREYKESLLANGVKMVFDPVTGVETLPSEHLIETQEFLITAASKVVANMITKPFNSDKA
ncbi:RNA polymerase binding protein [Serratia phage 92A1]|nr:RNA polymerase binding protein [Serratia phage 92A1]